MHYKTTFITKNRTEFFAFQVPFGSLSIFQTKAPRYLETKHASFRFSRFLTKRLSSPQAFVLLYSPSFTPRERKTTVVRASIERLSHKHGIDARSVYGQIAIAAALAGGKTKRAGIDEENALLLANERAVRMAV